MAAIQPVEVLWTHHWTDRLFSFRTTRDTSLRFEAGQFVMLGLPVDGRPLLRAYSIASAPYDDYLEFFSIKVPDGPLTSILQSVEPGREILVGRKPTGTLLSSSLRPGRTLYLIATGTGLAPFLSLIRDPDVYERFERVALVHGCRHAEDLAYRDWICTDLRNDPLVGEMVSGALVYHPVITRDDPAQNKRVTCRIADGSLAEELGLPPLDPDRDRVLLCGSMSMLADMRAILEEMGFDEGTLSEPGDFVYEKAFVD
jgi:ferredoxin--NADP+ reductase